jgi:hypothetical protein
VGAAVAADTVVEIGDPLLAMLGNDPGWLVGVAAVAAIGLEAAGGVAGGAGGLVVAFQQEIAVMGKGCGLPLCGLVTGGTGCDLTPMQAVGWR